MTYIRIFLILLISTYTFADTAKWNSSEYADGYKIYYGEHVKNVGNVTSYDLNNLEMMVKDGEYLMMITAYNPEGESGPSNEIMYLKKSKVPSPPKDVRIE